MKPLPKPRVVQLVKGIGPTSSPWTNFYGTLRPSHQGLMLPPLQVSLLRIHACFKWQHCRSQRRKYFSVGLFHAAFLLRKLSRRGNRPLIVHVHNPVLVFVPLFALLLGATIKVVTTQHNNWATFKIHQKACLFLAAHLSKSYVACGREVHASVPPFTKSLAHRGGSLHSVPNGIPAFFLRDYAKKRAALMLKDNERQEGTRTIVVARMAPQKNCFHLLHLISRIPDLGEVTWYGDGRLRKQVEEERDRLGLRNRVTLAGVVSRETVYDALVEHDFYLTVSLWEGLSVADLEAAAIGCMPLMSDIPQRREIAETVGFDLLPAHDVGAWRREVERYLSMTHHERAHFSRKLSQHTCTAFSLESMAQSYADIYFTVGS